jgi:hypothetical protein
MSVISQEHLLSTLAKVPDEEWLAPDLTDDQRKYWHELKSGYIRLGNELDAYFNGQETTLTSTKKDREIGIIADYYISLYSLIQVNFSAIKKVFQEVYCPPELYEIEELKSPGTLFKSLIWCEALFHFDICTKGHFTWTPSGSLKERELINILRDQSISKHKRLQAQRKLRPQIAEFKNELKNQFSPLCPTRLVIEACQKEARKNSRVKNKLDDFNLCFERLDQTLYKNLRKKAKGFGFSKGQRIYPSRYGGTWKTSTEISA